MGWWGVAADIGASAATTAIFAATKTPLGLGVAVIGGAVGGAVGQIVDDKGDIDWGNIVGSAASGAIGGLVGGFAAKGISKGLDSWAKSAGKKVDDLGKPDDLKAADEAVVQADRDLGIVEAELTRHRGRGRPKLPGKKQDAYDQKTDRLERERAQLEGTRDDLKKKADDLRSKTASSDELKKAEATKERAESWRDSKLNLPFHSLVALGSAGVRALWTRDRSGSDGGAGSSEEGREEAATETVPLTWSGLQAANAVGLWGKSPFVVMPGFTTATGSGFLLHPEELNTSIATWYGGASNSFASSLAENYRMFGDLEKKEDLSITPIRSLVTPAAVSSGSESGESYAQAAQALNASAQGLNQTQADLAGTLEKVEEITRTGQENIGNLIAGVNTFMGQFPPGDIDATFLSVLNKAINEELQIMSDAAASAELAANTIGNPDMNSFPSGDALGNAVGQIGSGLDNSALWPVSPQAPSPISDLEALTPDPIDTDSGLSPEFEDAAARIPEPAAVTPPPAGAAFGGAGVDPSAGLMNSMMSSMLPMMMQQAMMRNAADSDLAARRADLDPSRYEQNRAMAAPPPVAPPVHTTPWSTQNAAATPAAATPQQAQPQTHTGPGAGTTSSQAGAGTPPRTPGEDGSIVYTFPDGRTQKVSPTVAKVLDEAFANIKATDAQEAYADTEAKWTDPKEIGIRVDPFQLMTGDVAAWDDRTAVLVVFGAGEEGTLEAIVNGELQPFAPQMSDSAGEFGQFTGFRHPPGIELGAKDKGDTGTPSGDPQPATSTGDAPLAIASA